MIYLETGYKTGFGGNDNVFFDANNGYCGVALDTLQWTSKSVVANCEFVTWSAKLSRV